MKTWAIVLAAGRGTRAGLGENKVFFRWNGRSVLSRCLDAFADSGLVDGVTLVLSPDDMPRYEELCVREGRPGIVRGIAMGGDTRRQSVRNGLKAVPEDADIIAVHDGARPFVAREVIAETIRSAAEHGSGVICTPVTDTIKQTMPDGTIITPDRATLRAVQTPQTFAADRLREAHEKAESEGLEVTDDAMLFEHYYGHVYLVTAPHAEENIKLTTQADFRKLSMPAFRVGSGYDVHRLTEGRKLILCGVDVPHTMGLDGHSDADVAVHALMDAILGALGEGDIGRHFPDTDEKYRGIDSMLLLEHVMGIAREHGYAVANADVTIVAQRPKLAPYIGTMCDNLRAALCTEAVNVKATTTEKLGFEGRGEGISAQAVVLLIKE